MRTEGVVVEYLSILSPCQFLRFSTIGVARANESSWPNVSGKGRPQRHLLCLLLFLLAPLSLLPPADGKKTPEQHVATIFIAGGQKCGSSSLFEVLTQHKKLLKGTHKEPHFWNTGDFLKGLGYYSSTFFPQEKFVGGRDARFIDGTPMLEFGSAPWRRLVDTYTAAASGPSSSSSSSSPSPDSLPPEVAALRFIVVLREPVSRDYSWYMHATRLELFMGQQLNSVETMKELEGKRGGSGQGQRGGRYVEQLREMMTVLPRRQVFIVSLASLIGDTKGTLERIRRFLGVSRDTAFEQPFPHDDHLRAFRKRGSEKELLCLLRHVPQLDCALRDGLGDAYRDVNQELYAYLNNATRAQADPNEPFFPPFADYRSIPCAPDARATYNALLADTDGGSGGGRSGSGGGDAAVASRDFNVSVQGDRATAAGMRRRAQHVYLEDRLGEVRGGKGTCREEKRVRVRA